MTYTGAVPALELTLQRPFVADHFHDLPGFQEDRHGHNWTVDATVGLPGSEDAAHAEAALDRWVASVDYRLLNPEVRLAGRNPTAELLAQWCFEDLVAAGVQTVRVKVREKANYWAACERCAEPGTTG
jgi:6-pyruvoyl-tetrahydropterin synthase